MLLLSVAPTIRGCRNKAKTKEIMSNVKKSAPYFNAYPKVDAFYVTSDGSFFPEENKSMAESHQRLLKKGKVEVITRNEAGVSDDETTTPEGEPSKDWKNDDLKAYMSKNSIAFEDSDKKADLLDKIEAVKETE